jgi:acyl-CoA synthetase (AMP-forming)/AMP-acid ligase II/thioesterase domain-containing protein
LNPAYKLEEFKFFLADLDPQVLIAEAGRTPAALAAANELGIPVLLLQPLAGSPAGIFDLAPVHGAQSRRSTAPSSEDCALLLHTSGTTSRPKLVGLSRANLQASAASIAGVLGLAAGDRCLNVMPLFHIHGLAASLLASLQSGASVVCCNGVIPQALSAQFEEFQPTWYTAVPTIHQTVLGAIAGGGVASRHSLRFIRSCSSPLPPTLMDELESAFQVPVVEAYGMTEAAHQMASNRLPPGRRKPASVGAEAGAELRVLDVDGIGAEPGRRGEVVVRGPNVIRGYINNETANLDAFRDGWFRTGDAGWFDEEGYLFLAGRLKEIVNRGGEKISPREIDEVLLRHPAVAQAVAFPAPHPRLGETVAAAVVLRPGHEVPPDELRRFAARYLVEFKVPEAILLVPEIPKGPTGKFQRASLASKLGMDSLRQAPAGGGSDGPPSSELETKLVRVFSDVLRLPGIGIDDDFYKLGGDSLAATALMAHLQQLGLPEITLADLREHSTVAALAARLASSVDTTRPAKDKDSLRITLQLGSGLPPLFCVPGSYGNAAGFAALAGLLGAQRPVYAFRLPKAAKASAPARIEQVAERYVREVLTAAPDRICHLVGMCTGGLIVFEMARQLRRMGWTPGALALIDCYNLAWGRRLPLSESARYRLSGLSRRALYHWRTLRSMDTGGRAAYLGKRLSALARVGRERGAEMIHRSLLGCGLRPPSPFLTPRLAIRQAASQYSPQPLDVGLLLFRISDPRDEAPDYPFMGWSGIAAGGAELFEIAGGHESALAEPCVRGIAGPLCAALAHHERLSGKTV